jgi:nicotinic acid phosphoribosyltransferase
MANTLAYLSTASNNKLECFSLTNLSAKTNFMKKVLQVKRRSLAIITNIRLVRHGFQMANTLAYLSESLNNKLECFPRTNLSANTNFMKKVLQVKRSVALTTNIRLVRNGSQMANTLAYLKLETNWLEFLYLERLFSLV